MGEVVEEDAGEDGAEFAGGGADAVGEAADTRGEDFARDDEGGGVGAKIEEELGENLLVLLEEAKLASEGEVPERW